LHQVKGIAHLDIKLENIVVDSQYIIKLIDFAYCEAKDQRMFNAKGTERYFAPEVAQIYYSRQVWHPDNLLVKPSYVAEKADIFSLGILLFTLYFGQPPFTHNIPESSPLLPYLCDPRPEYQEVFYCNSSVTSQMNF
jgi:serine/threonine protein kinase